MSTPRGRVRAGREISQAGSIVFKSITINRGLNVLVITAMLVVGLIATSAPPYWPVATATGILAISRPAPRSKIDADLSGRFTATATLVLELIASFSNPVPAGADETTFWTWWNGALPS